MEEPVFPPSPTWFLPNIMSVRKDGSVSYGTKNSVVILKPLNKKMEMLIINSAHKLKVTGVAFSPPNCDESIQNSVVSCSEDGFVKLWKIDTLTATIGHKIHGEKNAEAPKVISLDWSVANPHFVVSAAENNTLVLWNTLTNSTTKFSFQKLGPTVVSCCPHSEGIVAVGGKNGQICIINLTKNGEVLYRLRGHDNQIHSLSWCTIPYNVLRQTDICEEFLLASSCQNKEVFIWRAGSDGKCETKFLIPTNALIKRDNRKVKNTFNVVAVCWLEPYKIYLSSNFGELIYFDVKSYASCVGGEVNRRTSFIKVAHYHHTKGLFAIAGSPLEGEIVMHESMDVKSELKFPNQNKSVKITKKEEGDKTWEVITAELSSSSSILWTAGQDRKLIGYELKSPEMEIIYNYNTVNGTIYSIIVSPHDPNTVAVGAGDGMIRLWNLTDTSGDIQVYWQKIKDRVMSLDWHPTKDGVLAYGTSQGRVGFLDTKSTKLPNVFKPGCPYPVYSLSWGPQFRAESNNEGSSEFDLYVILDNSLLSYSPLKLKSDPINLSNIISFRSKKLTDVRWKPDHTVMVVGGDDGIITLVKSSDFTVILNIHTQKKQIQSIAWHPAYTAVDMGLSPYHGYFTSGWKGSSRDVSVFNYKYDEKIIEQVVRLEGHQSHVQSVSWCPHISGRLVAITVDFAVYIWNVLSKTLLHSFALAGMPVIAIWSPIDPDLILAGCKNSLCVWRESVQREVHCFEGQTTNLKKEKSSKINLAKETTGGDDTTEIPPLMGNDEMVSASETKPPANNAKEAKMFSKFWKGDEKEEFKICYCLLNKNDSEPQYLLPFFGEEIFFHESLRAEEELCRKTNKWTEVYELALWSGNLKSVLEEKIKTGQLNDFLVSLAPAISPRLWQDACRAYSKALREKKFYRKAASYLLICHNIFESINLLMDADLYLEALCIAKSRLPSTDPTFKEIVRRFAEWLFKNGSILKACECYLYLGDYLEVAKICSKKNDPQYSRLAALAAKKCNCFDLQCLEAISALFKCFEMENIDLAKQICEDNNNLKILSLIYHIYLTVHKLEAGELDLKINILSHVRETFKVNNFAFPSSVPLLFNKYVYYKNRREVMSIVAQELTLAFCAKKTDKVFVHLIKALSACSRYIPSTAAEVHPLCNLCHWLSPTGYLSPFGFFSCRNSRLNEKTKSLRAFLCASIIRHVSDNRETDPDNTGYFDVLRELHGDLMDRDSYNYFKNLLQVEICEKRILKNRSLLSRNIFTEDNNVADNANDLEIYQVDELEVGSEVSEDESESKNVEDLKMDSPKSPRGKPESPKSKTSSKSPENGNVIASSKTDTVGGSERESDSESPRRTPTEDDRGIAHSKDNSKEREMLARSLNPGEGKGRNSNETQDNVDRKVKQKLKILEEKIFRDVNKLRKLRNAIDMFETERVSAPNPVPNYFLLKKFCEEFSDNSDAIHLLKELEEKWNSFY